MCVDFLRLKESPGAGAKPAAPEAIIRHWNAGALYVPFTRVLKIRAKSVSICLVSIVAGALFETSHGAAAPRGAATADPQPETVFSWRQDRCDDSQYPDAPARAYRDADGQVHLFATHYDNRAMVGPALDRVRIDCRSTYAAPRSDDPAAFDDRVWLTSFHTDDGRNVVALGHAEFHGHLRANLCPMREYRSCWWNAVVALSSHDGGATFQRPAAGSLVAVPRGPYDPSARRPIGYFSPSNIVAHDGALFAFIFAEPHGAQARGPCLLRAEATGPSRPWRGWNGRAFAADLSAGAESCTPITGLGATVTSVARLQSVDGFAALIAAARGEGDARRRGVYIAYSEDLLRWSAPQLLLEAPLMFNFGCADSAAYGYPSLLDAASPSRNFESVGTDAWLYLTRFSVSACKLGPERDLVRFRVKLSGAAAP
jgi:hypothetical protein